MGLFNKKKICSYCNCETGMLSFKLKDGRLCKKCYDSLSKRGYGNSFKYTLEEVTKLLQSNKIKCDHCDIELKDDINFFNNKYYCENCLNTIKINEKEQKNLLKKEKQKEYSQLQERAKIFKERCTTHVEKYIYFDDNINEIFIPDFWTRPKFIKYNEILDFELLEDGNSISSGGVGRAVAGGVLFGGAGAIVGSVTGKKKSTNIATSMQIKITTKDINNPVIFIKIFKGEHKKGSIVYNSFQKNAHKIISMLQITVDRVTQDSLNNSSLIQESSKSKIDELKELKELLDSGILTQEEFDSEKAKILNR